MPRLPPDLNRIIKSNEYVQDLSKTSLGLIEMRTSSFPVVSIFGTALAICMIMVIVIVWQMRTANYAPEDYRDRMMYVSDTRASYKENESYNDCYLLASRVVKDCFYPLRSAEKVGMAYHGVQRLAAVADHTVEFKCDVTFTDAAFLEYLQLSLPLR